MGFVIVVVSQMDCLSIELYKVVAEGCVGGGVNCTSVIFIYENLYISIKLYMYLNICVFWYV